LLVAPWLLRAHYKKNWIKDGKGGNWENIIWNIYFVKPFMREDGQLLAMGKKIPPWNASMDSLFKEGKRSLLKEDT